MRYAVYIPLDSKETARVELADNKTTLIRNLQRNFDLLRNFTGLTATLLPDRRGDIFSFQVNASRVHTLKSNPTEDKHFFAYYWIRGIIQGVLTLRMNGTGSQLYEIVDNVTGTYHGAAPIKKRKIQVGAYVGTFVPAFIIVVFTAGTALVYIIICSILKSPPGGSWELLEAHGREHGDRILAGPPGDVINIHAKHDNRDENLEKARVHTIQ